MKLQVLQEASVVASTLSFAGSAVFHRLGKHFDVVIIDEAAQAVEPSTLVPLVHGCKQVSMPRGEGTRACCGRKGDVKGTDGEKARRRGWERRWRWEGPGEGGGGGEVMKEGWALGRRSRAHAG